MANQRVVLSNVYGVTTKAVSVTGDEGWDIAGSSKTEIIWNTLAWPYRGLTVISDKISSIPFEIQRNGQTVDTSEDYKNVVGFLPDLKNLIWLLSASQTLCGSAYAFSDNVGKMRKKLRYILPGSITDIKFAENGEIIFTRVSTINNVTKPRQYMGGQDIIYWWMPDPEVETGAPKSAPMIAAMSAAGVLKGMDGYVKLYWERGAIKAMMFVTDGNMPEEQQSKLLNWYKNVIQGLKNAFNAGIFNGAKITPTAIGDGIEGLKDTELTKEKREDISTALGIPQSILFSTGASGIGGGGVVDGDMLKFMTDTCIPRAERLVEGFNTLVFAGTPYSLKLQPRKLAIFQKNEGERAAALNNFAAYIEKMSAQDIDPVLGFDILGYSLSDAQKAALIAAWNAKQAKKEPVIIEAPVTPPAQPEPVPAEPAKSADLQKWQRKAVKHIGQAVPFESDEIPLQVAEFIRLNLPTCQNEGEIKSLFARAEQTSLTPGALAPDNSAALKTLADAITQAAKAEPAQMSPGQTINISLPNISVTANVPAGEPVIVNVPAQEPPVVNVSTPVPLVSVDAPIVNVTNQPAEVTVNVQPSQVVFPSGPKQAEITTDPITGKKTLKVTK